MGDKKIKTLYNNINIADGFSWFLETSENQSAMIQIIRSGFAA
jgi:hypothetical protein